LWHHATAGNSLFGSVTVCTASIWKGTFIPVMNFALSLCASFVPALTDPAAVFLLSSTMSSILYFFTSRNTTLGDVCPFTVDGLPGMASRTSYQGKICMTDQSVFPKLPKITQNVSVMSREI
jgi:hypothetical protein